MDLMQHLQAALGSAYAIERELGSGGMSRVFLAEERRFRRKVVVKVLETTQTADINAGRFEREVEFAAQLQHPHIVPLLVAGDADGIPYYTMPFIDGDSLAGRLARGPLTIRETIAVLRDVARALAFAHARGVVHRDIKPGNILVTAGSAVVTDFGIAKAIAESRAPADDVTPSRASLTGFGVAVGTPSYMAPEQIAAETQIDQRADIYAFGCVAFEMLVGAPPFSAPTLAQVLSAHLARKPERVGERRSGVPRSLEALIERCLEKDAANRPRGAEDLLEALERAAAELSDAEAVPRRTVAIEAPHVSIAVLPFKDLTGDQANEFLGIGLADATITELASISAIVVRPTNAILPYRQRNIPAVQAARELSVDAVVDGNFQRSGNRLRITVQLIGADSASSLWGTRLTGSLDDVFVLQDEVARQIAAALEVNLTRAAGAPRARAATIQGDAFELFARGRSHLLTQSLEDANRAVECFQKALELDPSFARAYAGLADAYARIAFTWIPEGEWYDRAEAMCTRALALDPQLAEGRYLRGRLLWSPRGGFDHAGAIREFTAAIAAQPSLNEAHHWLGILLFHVSLLDESAACMERALAIDPNDRTALLNLGYRAYLAGRLEEALRVSRESGRDVTSAWNLYTVALVHVQSGSLDAAEQSAEVAARRFPADVLFHPLRALIAALRGDRAAALRHIETTVRNERAFGHYHHAQYDVACAYAQLGVADQAIAWLTAAAKHGFPCAAFFERDRLLDPLRSEPEFQHVVAAARRECEEYARLYRSLRAS